MHRSKLPLTVWFWGAHLMATHSNGMSAVQLEAQLGITYKTAWLPSASRWRAWWRSTRPNYLSGPTTAFSIPCKSGKILIAGAVEVIAEF
jgi:hypothetical protein